MITSSAWVPRGYAAPFPIKQEFDEEEFDRIAALAKLQLDDAKEDLQEARKGNSDSEPENDGASQKNGTAEANEKPMRYVVVPRLPMLIQCTWLLTAAEESRRMTTT